MKEQATRHSDHEWFAAWMPQTPKPADHLEIIAPKLILLNAIEEVRIELKAVTEHLMDPTTQEIRASLPHLERAVIAFGSFVKTKQLPTIEPALDALRAELTLATLLFENAYTLQAGWAAQCGLNLDGTQKQVLYSRPGELSTLPPRCEASEVWEG